MRQRQCVTEARADRGFSLAPGEPGGTNSSREGEPRRDMEFVVQKHRDQVARGMLDVTESRSTAVMEDDAEELIVALVKAVESGLQIILREVGAEAHLPSGVGGASMLG